MNPRQQEIVESFRDLRVLVIGEAMLDRYLLGDAARICREAPVPIVDVRARDVAPGGAANAAVNAAALGAQTSFVSVTGDDVEAEALRAALARHGVETSGVVAAPGRRTLSKNRVVAASQLLVRFDEGTTEEIDEQTEDELIATLREALPQVDALIVSDYGYGVLTPAVVQAIADVRSLRRFVIVVDSRDLASYRAVRPDAIKPNYDEATRLLQLDRAEGPDARARQIEAESQRLLALTGARIAAITLDSDGAIVIERGAHPYRTYARPAKNSNAAGAGDTFVAALAAALAADAGTPAAAELASVAAAVVVGKDGTSYCSAGDLAEALSSDTKSVADVGRFAQRLEYYRAQGKRIVFTNGCFDILHRGHVTYLNRAKALGDVLIVGVNSDASIRRLKGEGRPINSLDDRLQVLAAVSCIDYVVAFDDDTPVELLRAVRPHVFVKGGDYRRETLPEAPVVEAMGGSVQILPYLEERSTTNVIERIRRTYGEPAAGVA